MIGKILVYVLYLLNSTKEGHLYVVYTFKHCVPIKIEKKEREEEIEGEGEEGEEEELFTRTHE